jgi:transposase-like protein
MSSTINFGTAKSRLRDRVTYLTNRLKRLEAEHAALTEDRRVLSEALCDVEAERQRFESEKARAVAQLSEPPHRLVTWIKERIHAARSLALKLRR